MDVCPCQEDYELEVARAQTLGVQSSHLFTSILQKGGHFCGCELPPPPSYSLENVTREKQGILTSSDLCPVPHEVPVGVSLCSRCLSCAYVYVLVCMYM